MVENKNYCSEIKPLNDEERQLLLANFGWSPEKATSMLEDLGYTEEMWNEIYAKKRGSHEWRAYVEIARGTEVQLLGEVVMRIRKEDGLPPVRPI
jgi:hypothetical protein